MRTTLSLLVCLVLFSFHAQAQEKKFKGKFGKISPEELAMTSYEGDPSAPAVILFDRAEFSNMYRPTQGFIFEMERHVRIKIFNKAAYDEANIILPYFNDENIKDLKAASYNLENGVLVETKLVKENVFEEKLSRFFKVKKLTIPAVREGTIIEYKYTRTNLGFDVPNWVFQDTEIPTIWSEYKASVPIFIDYRLMAQGSVPFSVAKNEEKTIIGTGFTYRTQEMHYVQENIPALKPEPFMGAVKDNRSQIYFDIRAIYEIHLSQSGYLENGRQVDKRSNWENISKELLEDVYAEPLAATKFTEAETATQIEGKSNITDKIAALYAFIGKNYECQKYDLLWMSQSMADITKRRKGTPTELNILLINMLQRAKIKAFPLAVSTVDNGKLYTYRVAIDAFNRILTAVENEDKTFTIIDASAWPHPLGLLPAEDLNNVGLLLRDQSSVLWVPLENKATTRSAIQAKLVLSPEGTLLGKMQFSQAGYGAVEARTDIVDATKDAPKYLLEKFPGLFSDGHLSHLVIEPLDKWQEPTLKWAFDFESAGFAQLAGNKLYFHPSLGMGLKENPFKNPERKFDIEFGYPYTNIHNFEIAIPQGYKVEEVPKSIKMTFGENALLFEYYAETTADLIKITIRNSLKQTFVPVEEYPDLQQFYGNIVSKLEEQIVLTKQ